MEKSSKKNVSKAKRRSIVIALGLSLILILSGALALFTSRSSSNFKAQAGTVKIEVAGLNLTNSTNVNPGDMDPTNSSDGFTKGTPHEFSYTVYSLGTKSSRARHTILLSADKAGESTDYLDASVFKLFVHETEDELFKDEIIDEETGIVLQGRYYILSNDTEIKSLEELDELRKEDDTLFVKAVKYTWMGNIYDGLGRDIKKGGNAEKEDPENLISIVPDVKLIQEDENGNICESFLFDFGMMRTASNKYQGCDINIDVIEECMQYRNTTDDDWKLVSQVDKTYSTAQAHLTTVPATNENKWGDELYESENSKQSEYDASVSASISQSIEDAKTQTSEETLTEPTTEIPSEEITETPTTETTSESEEQIEEDVNTDTKTTPGPEETLTEPETMVPEEVVDKVSDTQ